MPRSISRFRKKVEIAGCPAARIVGNIGDDNRSAIDRERLVQRLVDCQIARQEIVPHGEELLTERASDVLRLCPVPVGDDERLRPDIGHVAPNEAMSE